MKQGARIRQVAIMVDHLFGSLRLVERKGGAGLLGVDLASGTEEALATFRQAGLRIVALVPGSWSKRRLSVLKAHLDGCDEVLSAGKRLRRTPRRLAARLDVTGTRTLFVAADRVLRGQAVQRGYLAAPGPAVAALAVGGGTVRFLRTRGRRRHLAALPDFVPYFFESVGDGEWRVLGAGTPTTLAAALVRGLDLDLLPVDLATEDPVLVQLDGPEQREAAAALDVRLLTAESSRVFVAVGPSRSAESLRIRGAHGHLQLLTPSPDLLRPPPRPGDSLRAARLALGHWPLDKVQVERSIHDVVRSRKFALLCPVTAASVQADVDRYSGVAPLDGAGPIVSRHVEHPDNGRVVEALLAELRSIGYCAHTHSFSHAGQILRNVIADLPGTGVLQIAPWILEELRRVLVRYPLPEPPDPWVREVSEIVGKRWMGRLRRERPDPRRLRRRLERVFELRAWYPWWRRVCLASGLGAELVIVGCHLDSSANMAAGYDPVTDPAPGADDDASGIAATLAIARYLWGYRGKLPHTVRFCFFNGEEEGLVGSKAYAAAMKAADAPIKAVICADMLGYNSDCNRIYELHAGYTDAAVRDLSVPLADAIAGWSQSLGALAPAQIYKGTIAHGGTDRNLYDGAINRSDHAAFHQQGYPAVLASEDFFANLPSEPGADPNPNYHAAGDTVIDSSYVADITCALAFAVGELAGG